MKYKNKEEQRVEKYAKVSKIALDISKQIVRNEEEWKKYLVTASRVYKYDFHEQMMIYAQRPDAKAVASMDIWNDRMFCWIKRGAKGIALLDQDATEKNKLKYVFDVSDVVKAKRIGRDPNLWKMEDSYKDSVMKRLESTYGKTDSGASFEDRLIELSENIARDYLPEVLEELDFAKLGTYLEELDDVNLSIRVEETLQSSIAFILLNRCDIDVAQYRDQLHFDFIHEFNSFDAITALGTAASEMAKPVLQEIGREIRAIEKRIEKKRNHDQKDVAKDINLDCNALKCESTNGDINQSKEGGNRDEHHIQSERGLSDPEYHSGRDTKRNCDKIWTDEITVFEEPQERDVQRTTPEGYFAFSSPYDTRSSRGERRPLNITVEGESERDRRIEGEKSDEVGRDDEQYPSYGTGDHSSGDYLRLEESKEPIKTLGYMQLSFLPTEIEQMSNIKATEAKVNTNAPLIAIHGSLLRTSRNSSVRS